MDLTPTQLHDTYRIFCECEGSLVETARAMGLSVGGVYHRLRKLASVSELRRIRQEAKGLELEGLRRMPVVSICKLQQSSPGAFVAMANAILRGEMTYSAPRRVRRGSWQW